MKNINLIRDHKGHSHVLKYPASRQDIVKYQLEIINDEEQLNFLKINYEDEEFLIVDITSLIPLNIYFQNYCDVYKRIKLLFITLIEVLEECEHFLLDLDCIVIDEKHCFYNIEMSRVSLIYMPVKEIRRISIHERVKNMFLGMIFLNIDMEYIKSVNALTVMINQLQQKDFDIYVFKQLIENYEEKKEVEEKITWFSKIFKAKPERIIIAEEKPKYNVQEDVTIMLETIETLPCLEFQDNQRITINKDSFLIGRSNQLSDYSLPEELALGRVHAEILKENSSYFIIDLHTKNGTYINGNRLVSQKKYKIEIGDELKFATKIAVFR